MNDIDFCVEYVKRINQSFKSKTSIQMVEIVSHGKKIPINEMFDDESLLKLHKDSVNLFVYKFIRDNQNCFFGCSGYELPSPIRNSLLIAGDCAATMKPHFIVVDGNL